MFHKKKGPDRAFSHADDCPILKADPHVQIPWSELESGHFAAICQCGSQHYYAPAGKRARQDPLDPATSRHATQCEFVGEAEPSVLRLILKATEREGSYWWVQCSACEYGWQVPFFYAEETVG